ncbi:hypothetical protein GMORB2_5122 [Geosmithia morbida]|uniref:Palmitoyltransferase n=1 Tax=Geosmithia morbida TaxID=1094350 RepID=A0A9P5D5E0_9HYPO|nr:uncharacterized protein GMORB2_5122 [Geosmithia morbida]KAF4124456.1 hypothetical protein GMORB2_5122 [Geosmithia morbida]
MAKSPRTVSRSHEPPQQRALSGEGGVEDTPHRPRTSASRKSRAESTKTAGSSRSKSRRAAAAALEGGSAGAAVPVQVEPATRTRNLSSRSHVPSLTSNAFFRPMSSQQLQAHRGTNRPPTMSRPPTEPLNISLDDGATDIGGPGPMIRHSLSSNPQLGEGDAGQQQQQQQPPSRGTDATNEQDRFTFNTSPTGNYAAGGSQADSVRPLHKNSDGGGNQHNLRVDVDTSYRDFGRNGIPSPVKSPRSLRSGFLLSGRDTGSGRAEKLSSGASSPEMRGRSGTLGTPDRHPTTLAGGSSSGADRGIGKASVWEYFDGNTRFFLGGRWQNTRGRPINIATGLAILVPCVLFFGGSAPWLWRNVSPAIPIVFAYLAYVCASSFIHASVSDPGILPRNLHHFPPISDDDPLQIGPATNDWTLVKSAESRTAAMEVPVKHCRTCNIWRPPRAHHCRMCDNCVETHDHHCVWINNCVGKRNYRYFFAFVASATALSLYAMATGLVQLLVYASREDVSFGEAVEHFNAPLALIILSALCLLYPAALTGYHVFLMSRGETTREYMNSHKFAKGERFRAYSQKSVWRNILAVLCRPRSPTYYRFKSRYHLGDQRLGLTHRSQRSKEGAQGMEMHSVNTTQQSNQQFQGPMTLRQESNHYQ